MTIGDNPSGYVFAYTGQGSQYPSMTARLWQEHPGYRGHLDEASEALAPHVGASVTELLTTGDARIDRTGFTQPAVFAVEYALTATLADAGVRPGAVIGHSIGEFAAAVAAGALGLAEAAYLVARRGALMQRLPAGGGMLAVGGPPEECAPELAAEPGVGIGAFNGADATVLSGDAEALDRIAARLAGRRVRHTRLKVSHAFHSALMEPMLGEYRLVAETVRPAVPELPFFSTVRGRRLAPGEPLGADYWVEHVASPVRFVQAATELLESGPARTTEALAVVEIGPKPLLAKLIGRLARSLDVVELPCLALVQGERTGAEDLDALIGRLSAEPAGAVPR